MAPIINTTKLVATAIATFVSMDKFIKMFSLQLCGHLDDHSFLNFPFVLDRFEFQRADGCHGEKLEEKFKNK
jgi:hypothetical protein